MAKLSDLRKQNADTAAKAAAAQGAQTEPERASYVDADPSVVAKIIAAMASGDLPWAAFGNGNLQFAVILPNGSVVNCYVNAKGTSAADRNVIHPAQREKKARKAAPDTAALTRGL